MYWSLTSYKRQKLLAGHKTYLLNCVREETLPWGPHGIVHGGQPLKKVNLSAVAICKSEGQLSKNKHNILVEVVED